jgi:hypothetical protein
MSSNQPVLQELAAILLVPTLLEDVKDFFSNQCLGITEKGCRCKRSLGVTKYQTSMALWSQFGLMEDCIVTEQLKEQIQTFIQNAHCKQHIDKSVIKYEAWLVDHGAKKGLSVSLSTPTESSNPDPSLASFSHDSTMTITEPDETSRMEDTLEIEDDMGIKVEAVTQVFSAMAVTDNKVKAAAVVVTITKVVAATTENDIKTTGAQNSTSEVLPQRIKGLGTVSLLRRKDSLRSPASYYEKVYSNLDLSEQELGVIYILRHKTENLFKIGYTKYSSSKRRSMGKRCNADNSESIYQSPQGHFFAARKAEKIAHLLLRQHNVMVEDCVTCGGGHKEWFCAAEKEILRVVKAVEAFVRLPAYFDCPIEKQWKLTDAAVKEATLLWDSTPQNTAKSLRPRPPCVS